MSAHNACTCGRKRGDRSDLVVLALKCNYSAFNGYHYTRSSYSLVSCIRPNCTGAWRTPLDFVYDLPNCSRDYAKYDRLKQELATRIQENKEPQNVLAF